MEVVIDGNLVRAADGNGFRAFAAEGGRIKESARLLDTASLSNVINATAVWQVASVLVAQKHLADINKKLKDIKAGVENLSSFLDSQRRSRIDGTYDYLKQAYRAIKGGELPRAVRSELESCERDLAQILHHLRHEYRCTVERMVEPTETVGTEKLTEDISRKFDKLVQLGQDIDLCLKARIAAWHVLCLYPGESQLKLARRTSIEESIDEMASLAPQLLDTLAREIAKVHSMWNRESTLSERRAGLAKKASLILEALADSSKSAKGGLSRSGKLLEKHDQPTRMWLQFEKGVISGAWVAHAR